MSVWAAGAAIGGAVISGVMTKNAAGDAASAAAGGDKAAIALQQQTAALLNKMLKPYRKAGEKGLGGQLDLLGLNGNDAQAAAIKALEGSPQFTSLVKSGENALLQNASATGGLRGGNTSAALAQFRPQMLSQIIESQYGKLAGLSALGENAAAQTGNNMTNSTNQISGLLSNIGQTQGQGIIAQGQGYADMFGGIAKGIGQWAGGSQAVAPQTTTPASGGGLFGTYDWGSF